MAVNQKRVDEVAKVIYKHTINSMAGSIEDYKYVLSDTPEFQSQEWIRCSERVPEENQPVYFWSAGFFRIGQGEYRDGSFHENIGEYRACTHWMPRHVPAPPVEEESELVKYVRSQFAELGAEKNRLEERIAEVKRHEQKAKK